MLNPFGSEEDPRSYANLQKKLLRNVQSAKINEQIVEIIKRSYEAENVVLSHPERKRLFSQTIKRVLEDLTKELDDGSISV
jgi:hypothetical protein